MDKLVKQGLVLFMLFTSSLVWAKREEYNVELKNHLFYPAQINIPANTKIKLIIHNKDDTPEEFDSFDLNREKVIFPHKKAVIFIGPLPEGEYHFFGEFNPNSAKGKVIVTTELQAPQVQIPSGVNQDIKIKTTLIDKQASPSFLIQEGGTYAY
jgi:hypothetical protein